MNALAKIEPLTTVDRRRPTRMQSLPEWVELRIDMMELTTQPDPKTGRWREVYALPEKKLLTTDQKSVVRSHLSELDKYCRMTPDNDDAFGKATIVLVTKMLLVLPTSKTNDVGAEAKGDAYMMALGDVPSWAVEGAIRGWYRGEFGKDRDYRWAPGPNELREVSMIEAQKLGLRLGQLEHLISAEPLIDHSAEHCTLMREKLAAVLPHGEAIQRI
jgi:hypothetical protein